MRFAECVSLKGIAFCNQAGTDFLYALTISGGTWLNGTKMNLMREGKARVVPAF